MALFSNQNPSCLVVLHSRHCVAQHSQSTIPVGKAASCSNSLHCDQSLDWVYFWKQIALEVRCLFKVIWPAVEGSVGLRVWCGMVGGSKTT